MAPVTLTTKGPGLHKPPLGLSLAGKACRLREKWEQSLPLAQAGWGVRSSDIASDKHHFVH
eukprot:12458411-Alexandrium_andersonii.AAC.1